MIITRLSGGMGNQMFQYAIGKSIAAANKTKLLLDTHYYNLGIEKNRSYKLGHFQVTDPIAIVDDFKTIGIPNPAKQDALSKFLWKTYRLYEKLKPAVKRKIILEDDFTFNTAVLAHKGDCYLSGVWQSEKYFTSIKEELQEVFTLKEPMGTEGIKWSNSIQNSESVSIHIRRGDYITNTKTNQFHGTCSPAYYEKAVATIIAKVQNPTFFIFSDDIEWAKKNFTIPYPTNYVSNPNIPDFEELIIMSNAKHNIVANSSFSWWAAWLNKNTSKVVISPQKWFGGSNTDTSDLIPDSWIKV
jgi:hypothetical protein